MFNKKKEFTMENKYKFIGDVNDFSPISYMKVECMDLNSLMNLVNLGEDYINNGQKEHVYDLTNENDANCFAAMYGFHKTMECYNCKHKHWFGGTDYKMPFICGSCEAIDKIKTIFTIERLTEMVNSGYYKILELWFNIDKMFARETKIFLLISTSTYFKGEAKFETFRYDSIDALNEVVGKGTFFLEKMKVNEVAFTDKDGCYIIRVV